MDRCSLHPLYNKRALRQIITWFGPQFHTQSLPPLVWLRRNASSVQRRRTECLKPVWLQHRSSYKQKPELSITSVFDRTMDVLRFFGLGITFSKKSGLPLRKPAPICIAAETSTKFQRKFRRNKPPLMSPKFLSQ